MGDGPAPEGGADPVDAGAALDRVAAEVESGGRARRAGGAEHRGGAEPSVGGAGHVEARADRGPRAGLGGERAAGLDAGAGAAHRSGEAAQVGVGRLAADAVVASPIGRRTPGQGRGGGGGGSGASGARLALGRRAPHTDDGGEFINQRLVPWCRREQIRLTRGRPYRTNDRAWAERRPWPGVRRPVGDATTASAARRPTPTCAASWYIAATIGAQIAADWYSVFATCNVGLRWARMPRTLARSSRVFSKENECA